MSDDYQNDRDRLDRELATARTGLEEVIGTLRPEDLAEARRGGWTVGRVLQHLIESERGYAKLAARLAGRAGPDFPPIDSVPGLPEAFRNALQKSRRALLVAIDGVDEESFYRLQRLGHEEYSVASLLENVANHDREHADQIRGITSK